MALGLSLPQVSTLDVLAFMEYLLQSGMSAANITNYLTAIRSMLMIYNCDASTFRVHRIPLFIKSVKNNRPLKPIFKTDIDENHVIIVISHVIIFHIQLYLELCICSLILLSLGCQIFFHTQLPPLKHLCIGDLIFSQSAVVVALKWPKILQDRAKIVIISFSIGPLKIATIDHKGP